MRVASRGLAATLVRNTGLNFLGQIIQALVAVVAIPYVVHGLGVERFGVISLAWVTLWYFGLVDLGLGRATTQHVATSIGTENASFGLGEASIVASNYAAPGGTARVGVMGPTRMDYPSNLAAARAVARYLSRLLDDDEAAR